MKPEHEPVTVRAPAKVNLTLEVLGRRADGYHDIVSIMQTVDLCDTLVLVPADRLSLTCDLPELQTGDNLALRAAELLRAETGRSAGVHITLEKRIPVAAGLGGGSSDAAAVLRGLDRLWGLGMAPEEMAALGARLGSDVPFFLYGGTAMVHGRGDQVRPLSPASLKWLVLVAPEVSIPNKTASLYGRLSERNFTTGRLTRKLEARIRGGGDVPAQFLFNAFDPVALEAFPDLGRCRDAMHAVGAREVHVAGTGPTLFALVQRREIGTAIQLVLGHRYGWKTHLVTALTAEGSLA